MFRMCSTSMLSSGELTFKLHTWNSLCERVDAKIKEGFLI